MKPWTLARRLTEHNSGVEAKQTEPYHLHTWVLVAYVTGFPCQRPAMVDFQNKWQRVARYGLSDAAGHSTQSVMDFGRALVGENNKSNTSNLELIFSTAKFTIIKQQCDA